MTRDPVQNSCFVASPLNSIATSVSWSQCKKKTSFKRNILDPVSKHDVLPGSLQSRPYAADVFTLVGTCYCAAKKRTRVGHGQHVQLVEGRWFCNLSQRDTSQDPPWQKRKQYVRTSTPWWRTCPPDDHGCGLLLWSCLCSWIKGRQQSCSINSNIFMNSWESLERKEGNFAKKITPAPSPPKKIASFSISKGK